MKTFATLWLMLIGAGCIGYAFASLLAAHLAFGVSVVGISLFCVGCALEKPSQSRRAQACGLYDWRDC